MFTYLLLGQVFSYRERGKGCTYMNTAVLQPVVLEDGWSLIMAVSHPGGLSSGWSFIRVASDEGSHGGQFYNQ